MKLAPLIDAAPAIRLHAFAAMTAFALGIVQIAGLFTLMPGRIMYKVAFGD